MTEHATIYDIAKAANVSPATASKALNGRKDVSAATRALVLKTATEMGYRPNVHARTLKTRRSYLLGVVYEEHEGQWFSLDHPLFLPILNACKRQIESQGYELLFLSRRSYYDGENLLSHAFSREVDGLILVNFAHRELPLLVSASRGIPMVSCDSVVQGFPSIATDNTCAAQKAVEYLHSLGHERIAHIAGPVDGISTAGSERMDGYIAGLAVCGLPYDPSLIVEAAGWSVEDGRHAFEQLPFINGKPAFTAVFAAADFYVMGLRQTCLRMGISIPHDLSVIGFDDAQWTHYVEPGFTTFRQNKELLGITAGAVLIDMIEGRQVEDLIRVPAELIVRNSCRSR